MEYLSHTYSQIPELKEKMYTVSSLKKANQNNWCVN